jgi:hypothetical protein
MQKKFSTLILLILMLSAGNAFAQPRYQILDFRDPKLRTFSVFSQLGTANYFGDLCPTGDCYSNSKFSGGLGLSYRMNDYLFFSLNFQYYRIGGSDRETGNPSLIKRNLSFRADNFEASFLAHFEFLNYNTFRYLTRKEFPVSMFVFTGFGITTNSPQAQPAGGGDFVALRPLQTEGVDYSSVAAILPIGLGISYKVISNLEVTLKAGYRFTSSDYLDDVSGSYADPASLKSDVSRKFAFRGDEFGFTNYGTGTQRGNPDENDGYLLFNLSVQYNLPHVPFVNFLAGKKTTTKKGKVSEPSRQIRLR